jgi:hypothetical protein
VCVSFQKWISQKKSTLRSVLNGESLGQGQEGSEGMNAKFRIGSSMEVNVECVDGRGLESILGKAVAAVEGTKGKESTGTTEVSREQRLGK